MPSFEEITNQHPICQALQKLGYTDPTPVQEATISKTLTGQDLIIQAKTGSGKTLAYVMPMLIKLKELTLNDSSSTFALVITPTRELAQQVIEVISSLDSSLRPVCLIGGVDSKKNLDELQRNPQLVVGTPGRILDMLKQHALRLKKCRYFVLDEADEMLSMGFLEDVRAILSRLPDTRQGLFVSATISSRVNMLAHSFLSKPERIIVEDLESPLIEHFYCEVGGDLMAKPLALCDLVETMRPRSAIIFCNTKSDTQLVEALLRRRGFDARRINSDLSQKQRDRIMGQIRSGDLQLLVATDIAARGIDIDLIDLVVNFSIHDQTETYIHRTGRTGRAGRSGKALSLVGPRDFGAFHHLTKILNTITFQKLPLPTDTDVADARLAHLYEVIRQTEFTIKDRDLLVASKLLNELGSITERNEELESFIAKLCLYSIEHHLARETKSLDEEILSLNEELASREPQTKSVQNPKHSADPKTRHKKNSKNNSSESQPLGHQRAPQQKLRLYIGHGINQGMTKEVFTNLVFEMANLTSADLHNLIIRENYGYVDLQQPKAHSLIENLHGLKFKDTSLIIELASQISNNQDQRP